MAACRRGYRAAIGFSLPGRNRDSAGRRSAQSRERAEIDYDPLGEI